MSSALSLGVRSYILKTSHPKEVRGALRYVVDDEIVVD